MNLPLHELRRLAAAGSQAARRELSKRGRNGALKVNKQRAQMKALLEQRAIRDAAWKQQGLYRKTLETQPWKISPEDWAKQIKGMTDGSALYNLFTKGASFSYRPHHFTKQAEISPEDLRHLEYKKLPELKRILSDNYYNSKVTEDSPWLARLNAKYRGKHTADKLTDALRKHKDAPEIVAGSAIPRSTLSLDDVSHEDLRAVGFVPSYVAVPERGQTSMKTYRHPYSGMHVHEHKKNWMFHRDKWPSLSMLMKRYSMDKPEASLKDKLRFAAMVGLPTAAPHIIHEGLPGYINFTNNSILGSRSWEDLLEQGVDSAAPMRLGRAAGGVAAGALGLAGLGFLGNKVTGKNKGDQFSLLRGAGTLGGLLAGGALGNKIHQQLKDQGVQALQGPGWASTALLAGLPLLGAYGGHRVAKEFDGAEEDEVDW